LKRFNANNSRKDHQQNSIPITQDLTIAFCKKCRNEELNSRLQLFLKYFQKRELNGDFGAEEKGTVPSIYRSQSTIIFRDQRTAKGTTGK
jgi:hypothetical protein